MMTSLLHQFRATGTHERTALIGLLLFGLLGPHGPAAATLALLIIVGASLCQWRESISALRTDPVFWAFIPLAVYAFIRAAFAAAEFPDTAAEQWNEAIDLLLPVLFLLVAWWLRGDERRAIALLTLALAGFCLHLLLEFDWTRLPQYLEGQRDDITDSKLSTALYTGAAILGLVAFAPRIARAVVTMGRGTGAATGAALAVVATILIAAQLITQSRAVWLSLAGLVPLLLAFHWWRPRRNAGNGAHGRIVVAMVVVAVVGLGMFTADRIERRFMSEAHVIEQIATRDLADVQFSSIGARVHLWRFAAELIEQRPGFGWGPGTHATRFLAPLHDWGELERFGDLHNTWVEIQTRLGIVGLTLYAVVIGMLFMAGIRAFRRGDMPRDVGLFLGAALLLTGAWSLINCRILNPDFQYFIILLFAVMHTFTHPRPLPLERT